MRPAKPLGEAWLAFLTQQAMGQPTYVLYDAQNGEAFIQLRYRPHQAAADVTFMAPVLGRDHSAAPAWSYLLNGAGIEAAGCGIQRVFANLPASGAQVDVFQKAGFTLYAEEDLFRLDQEDMHPADRPPLDLRTQRAEDWPALQKLFVAITPQRVRHAEGGIGLSAAWEKNCQRYVLPAAEGKELAAALSIGLGGQVHWLRILVHPDARHVAEELVHWGLGTLTDQPPKVVYCNVRQYENGTREALATAGFKVHGTRSLMVRPTVASIRMSALEPLPALKSSAEPLPPAYRINGEPDFSSPDSRLAAETQRD
jgi:hypothetical protein